MSGATKPFTDALLSPLGVISPGTALTKTAVTPPALPKIPEPPAPSSLADTTQAALAERRRRALIGRASTVLAGEQGAAPVATKVLTGQ